MPVSFIVYQRLNQIQVSHVSTSIYAYLLFYYNGKASSFVAKVPTFTPYLIHIHSALEISKAKIKMNARI